MPRELSEQLREILAGAQRRGDIGRAALEDHAAHAMGFCDAWCADTGTEVDVPRMAVDLGSGAGIPGLILAELWPGTHWALVERSSRRADRLLLAVARLGWSDRVTVQATTAEVAGHDVALRELAELVVARGFARPATTAECGAALVAVGGRLIVSEPPDGPSRWPRGPLAHLGLEVASRYRAAGTGGHYVVLRKTSPLDERYPRRSGARGKPLF